MGGAFMKILGPKGLGLSGSEKQSEQQTQLDPTTQAMNNFRMTMMQNPDIWGQYQDMYMMGDTSQESLDRLMGSTQSNLNLNDWQNQARADTSTQQARDWLNQYTQTGEDKARQLFQERMESGTQSAQQGRDEWLQTGKQDINSWLQNYLGTGKQDLYNTFQQRQGQGRQDIYKTFQDYYGTGTQNLNETLQKELGAYGGIEDKMVGAGNNYMKQILGPQLGNEYALMGLARSGGRQEAEAKGAASIGLDIGKLMGQLTEGAYSRYGTGQQNLTNQAYGQVNQGLNELNSESYGQLNEGLNTLNNAAYGQAGQRTSDLNNAAYGQFNNIIAQLNQAGYTDLSKQLQQLWDTNYSGQAALQSQESSQLNSLNQMVPQTYENQQNAQFGREQAAFDASLTPQKWRQQGLNDWRNTYLTALNNTPYTPASTVKTKGSGNEGVLDTQIGGTAAAGVGAAAIGSERSIKTDIRHFDADEFLGLLKAYTFQYKEPDKHGHGLQAGTMVDELEQTELGRKFIVDSPDGKKVDYQGMSSVMLACLIELHARIAELEDALPG